MFKQGESGLMEEMNLDGTDFRLIKEQNNYSVRFNEIFPDDAGVYKVKMQLKMSNFEIENLKNIKI